MYINKKDIKAGNTYSALYKPDRHSSTMIIEFTVTNVTNNGTKSKLYAEAKDNKVVVKGVEDKVVSTYSLNWLGMLDIKRMKNITLK